MRGDLQYSSSFCEMPSPVDGRSASGNGDLYRLFYERESGIIRTNVRGFWSLDDTEAYFDHLGIFIEAGRRRFGRVRVLVDRRGNPVQLPEVASRMQRANVELYQSEDRLAVVVDSSLLKMQLHRLFRHEGSKAFLSYDAAVTWLQAQG